MVAMTRTRTDISDKFSVIFSHGIRSIGRNIVPYHDMCMG